jgi:glycogen debranching enzyme
MSVLFKPRRNNQVKISANVEETFERARQVLIENSTEHGIKAASTLYNQIWSRDSFITFIGSNMLGEERLFEAAKRTLTTLGRSKTSTGMIPVNFDLSRGKPRLFFAGATDASAWYIIGLANLYHTTQDRSLLGENLDHAIDAYIWLRYQDTTGAILIDSHPAADWMDNTVIRQGKTLYNNVLFLIATKCINYLCEESGKTMDKRFALDFETLKQRFNMLFAPDEEFMRSGYWPNIADTDKDYITNPPKGKMPFYPNFITFNHVDMHFDTLSNLLCIVSGISDKGMESSILSYIESNKVASPYPIKVLHPNMREGDKFFDKAYTDAKPKHWRNDEYCYHNGGIWPFVGGFYVVSLVGKDNNAASRELQSLAAANSVKRASGEVGFNEWLHGLSGEALGQDGQSWSAGMYVAAYLATKGKDPFAFLKT